MQARDEMQILKALDEEQDRLLKWFDYSHLSGYPRTISSWFSELALNLVQELQPGPERTVALRKLLEAKDAAVRAVIHPGG